MKELIKFADLTRSQIGDSEEDVKINFIVPLLEALGHDRLNFEHKYKDIFIRKGLPKTSAVIVETKKYGKLLDPEIAQLERYCKEERPLLGLITNGDELRIYSHGWRRPTHFTDKIIYSIKRTDLKDQKTCKRIYDILSRENLANDTAEDYVVKRENEIREGKKDTEQERKEFDRQIAAKKKEIEDLKKKKESAIQTITTKFLLPPILPISTDHYQPTTHERSQTRQTGTRASKTLLKVTLPDGETIQESKALDTFVNTNRHEIGERLIIKRHKNKILAYGHLLDNNNFKVLKGSIISTGTAPKFQTSARKSYNLRNQYLQDGTINSDRQFIRDVEFNSISSAASVIMGDSKNGNKEWKKE